MVAAAPVMAVGRRSVRRAMSGGFQVPKADSLLLERSLELIPLRTQGLVIPPIDSRLDLDQSFALGKMKKDLRVLVRSKHDRQ
jgi:hypothetical protein